MFSSNDDAVLLSRRDHIATITLNRPDGRNSMTNDLLEAFAACIDEVKNDTLLRALIITGNGSCFSAGADLNAQIQRGQEHLCSAERSFAMYTPFLSLLDIEIPTIAALNGHAVGGGFGLALLADIRIANESAKYGANFTRLGLHPGLGISYVLPRLIGVSRANELLFTGRLIKGSEAADIGLASRAVAGEKVKDTAWELASEIAQSAPMAVRLTKRTIRQNMDWQIAQAAYREAFAQAVTVQTEDFQEGKAALLAKRRPHFSGK